MSHAASGRFAVSRAGLLRRVPLPRPAPEAAPEPQPGDPLRTVRRIGFAVLGIKFLAFCAWSMVLYDHFALTPDFAQYQQAWYLIAHGHLNPYDTVGNFAFWQNHGEFIMWPLALLYWVSPGGVGLLWLQDAGVVGAELVAFVWGCELARKYAPGPHSKWMAASGLTLLAVNPWSWWSVSFDFHAECLAVLFIALLAWDLANGRRRAWLWIPLLLACGDVAGTYIFGLGVGLAVAVRGQRIRGGVVALAGIAAVLGFSAIHANLGSGHGLKAYDYLAAPGYSGSLTLTQLASGLATHPVAVAAKMWEKRVDIWANLGASGLLGAAFLPLLPITAVVMVSNDLFRGFLFSEPLFQSLPIYVLLPAGTVAILAMLGHWRKTALVLAAVLVAQAIGWSAVWSPRTVAQWQRVPTATAAMLSAVLKRIPPGAAVFASQGVVGRFSQRLVVRPMNGHLPIQPGWDWFVFTPWVGIETQKPAAAMVFAGQLAGRLHAKLMLDKDGIRVFRWRPPASVHRMIVPSGAAALPAWCAPGAAGRAVLTGNPATWHTTSTGKPGYIADRLEWARMAGRFKAKVTLSTNGPVNVEVWDNTGNVMLARDTVPYTHGKLSVTLPVDATHDYHVPLYGGWGPFRAKFGGGPKGQRIEVRVWSPGGEKVNVYSAQLLTVSR